MTRPETPDPTSVSLEAARVRRAMRRLPPLVREAFELAYFGGHTCREIALILEVSDATVAILVRDGLVLLCNELDVRNGQ